MKHDDLQMTLALDSPKETLPRQDHRDPQSPAPKPILVEVAEVPITGTEPQKYSATLVETGEVLVRKSRNASLEACRVLRQRGITGVVHTRRKDSDTIAMKLDIEKAARLDVREGYSDPPRFVRHDPQKQKENMAKFRERLPAMKRKTEVEA